METPLTPPAAPSVRSMGRGDRPNVYVSVESGARQLFLTQGGTTVGAELFLLSSIFLSLC